MSEQRTALLNRNSFILLDGEARILQHTVTLAEALGTRLAAPEEEKYSMDTLTIQLAFEAMQLFLVSYYERTQSEDVGALWVISNAWKMELQLIPLHGAASPCPALSQAGH
jgi:hypothetical protein